MADEAIGMDTVRRERQRRYLNLERNRLVLMTRIGGLERSETDARICEIDDELKKLEVTP
jgi:hypothetical protein